MEDLFLACDSVTYFRCHLASFKLNKRQKVKLSKAFHILMTLRTNEKQRMKALSIIAQCYNKRFELVKIEPDVNETKNILIW